MSFIKYNSVQEYTKVYKIKGCGDSEKDSVQSWKRFLVFIK